MGATYDDIEVLEWCDAVRRRPAMYVGALHDGLGLMNVVRGLLDAVVDAHREGAVRRMRVSVDPSGALEVEEDGPSCAAAPARPNSVSADSVSADSVSADSVSADSVSADSVSADTLVGRFAALRNAGATFGQSIANALSSRFEIETREANQTWRVTFEAGKLTAHPTCVAQIAPRGTRIRCWPDPRIFPSVVLDEAAIEAHLTHISWLYPLLEVTWNGKPLDARDGIRRWLPILAGAPLLGGQVFSGRRTACSPGALREVEAHVALGWRDRGAPIIHGFVRAHRVPRGTHIQGLYAGLELLARRIAPHARGEALLDGLVAVVHVEADDHDRDPDRVELLAPLALEAVRDATHRVSRHLPALALQRRFAIT